jgi:membrane protein implicated in regulation of membrane protease activity
MINKMFLTLVEEAAWGSSIEDYMIFIWLGVFVIALIVEICTTDVVSIWFCGASLISLILAAIPGVPFWVEIVVFVVLSVALLLALRPVVKKYFSKNNFKTNVDEMIGHKALVIKEISELQRGEVKINGIIWTAEAANPSEKIGKDDIVKILSIDGNKLIVKKIDNDDKTN